MRNSILTVVVGLMTLSISGTFSQTLVTNPQNKTVELGKSVVLECIFQGDVQCMWSRGLDGTPEEITGRYRFVSGDAIRKTDCSIEIINIEQTDLGPWGCATFKFNPIIIWLSKQKTPSQPKIYFMGKELKELVFPIPTNQAPATNLSCISEKGNPLPKLSWELDGQRIAGHTENITVVEDQVFSTLLTWNDGDWSRFGQNNGPLRCILEHPALRQLQVATVSFIQEYATKNVQIEVDGLSGDTFELDHNKELVFTCTTDGHPKPSIAWEFLPDGETDWTVAHKGDDRLVVNEPKDGRYRCSASNKLNTKGPVNSQEFFVKGKTAAETGNFGVVIGIIIGCLVILALVGLLVVFLYRRKKWIFAPKSDATPVNVDAEAVDHDNEKPTEKTPLESVPDPQYENLKQNGKEEEMNGKTDTSPIKNDQNDNKKSTEVVYAQLDLSKRGVAKVKLPPEYEKTEYAEITFNKDKGNNV